MPARAHRVLLPLIALLAVLPMFFSGPSCGHDFDFHLLSWLEAANQLRHGGYPHWAYTPAWNAGEPRFVFYPPLSWLLGAAVGLLVTAVGHLAKLSHPQELWNAVPVVFTWVCLALSGYTAHRFVRRFSSASAALVASTLYMVNPYMLFTAYERTAYGELLAAAWMPLLFAAALAGMPAVDWGDYPSFGKIGPAFARETLAVVLPVALLWLSNAPAAVMGCYALALLTLVRLFLPLGSSLRAPWIAPFAKSGLSMKTYFALTTLAGTALGLLLPAFYLLPAAYERRWISAQMAVIEGMRPADNTLFHHMLPVTDDSLYHDQVLHSASWIAIVLVCAIGVATLALWLRAGFKKTSGGLVAPLLVLTVVVAFLLTPASLWLWAHTPQLTFLQFPWRLCALLAPVLALVVALLLSSTNPPDRSPAPGKVRTAFSGTTEGLVAPVSMALRSSVVAAFLLAGTVIPTGWRDFHQFCDPEDAVDTRVALFHSPRGTEGTDEYTPIDADPDQLHPEDPPYWLMPESVGDNVNAAAPANAAPGQAPDRLILNLPAPRYLVLNRRAYPGWNILRNGHALPPDQMPQRDDGLIVAALPAGRSTITLQAIHLPDRTLGLVLSLLALLAAAVLAWRARASAGSCGTAG
jgi:hypothetical protein